LIVSHINSLFLNKKIQKIIISLKLVTVRHVKMGVAVILVEETIPVVVLTGQLVRTVKSRD
jgi:hypothetical protein